MSPSLTSLECFPVGDHLLSGTSDFPVATGVCLSPSLSGQPPSLVSLLHSLLTWRKQLVHGLASVDLTSGLFFVPEPLSPRGVAACRNTRSSLEGVGGGLEGPSAMAGTEEP